MKSVESRLLNFVTLKLFGTLEQPPCLKTDLMQMKRQENQSKTNLDVSHCHIRIHHSDQLFTDDMFYSYPFTLCVYVNLIYKDASTRTFVEVEHISQEVLFEDEHPKALTSG